MMLKHGLILAISLCSLTACSEEPGNSNPDQTSTSSGSGGGAGGAAAAEPGKELSVAVPSTGRVFIRLSTPEVVTIDGDGKSSKDWDLALSGYDILTNGGVSGSGDGKAFGPLDVRNFTLDGVPEVPFLTTDHTGGAFLTWYKYDGTEHALWSRYRLYGLRDGARLWKVQILSYYGLLQGAPVSALYQVRYAEVKDTGVDATQTLADIDGTAGGASPTTDVASECVDLSTGQRLMLKPSETIASKVWQLCFRRETVSVNGELGGPRGVTAVDLDAEANETLTEVQAKTEDTELPRFNATGAAELNDPKLTYRGDHIVTAFTDHWLEPGATPPAPREASWYVIGADGTSQYQIKFIRFEGPGADTPGTVVMRVRPVQ
jgi:hypothetical protein